VVKQPTARAEQREQRLAVPVELACPDVLGHTDRGDSVIRAVPDLAVVLHANLDTLAQPRLRDAVARQGRLLTRERHAEHPHPVVPRGVQRQAAPAAPHIEHPHPRLQPQLAADQLQLVPLRLLQPIPQTSRLGPIGTGIDQRRPKDQAVKIIAHVVVVPNGPGVPLR